MVALVLAAGLGRRFDMDNEQMDSATHGDGDAYTRRQATPTGKGQKQMTAVDDRGQTLLEYALYDAYLAGVDEVVMVVHPDRQQAVSQGIGARVGAKMCVRYAQQTAPALYGFAPDHPPLGTGHAFLCGAQGIRLPFIVLNADDFYGREAIALAVATARRGEYACVTYPVGQTVAGAPVHRGICLAQQGHLTGICECTFARDTTGRLYAQDGSCCRYVPEQTPVNMNLYAMQPGITPVAAHYFADYLQRGATGECLLGDMVTDFVGRTHQIVHNLPSPCAWHGMTYRLDLHALSRMIEGMVRRGIYPRHLWQ